eukprot:3915504-Pleurochrysis_carterae.AAC.1
MVLALAAAIAGEESSILRMCTPPASRLLRASARSDCGSLRRRRLLGRRGRIGGCTSSVHVGGRLATPTPLPDLV